MDNLNGHELNGSWAKVLALEKFHLRKKNEFNIISRSVSLRKIRFFNSKN